MIYADNKEAIEKGKKTEKPMNISETLTADYDLGETLQELIRITPVKCHLKWI